MAGKESGRHSQKMGEPLLKMKEGMMMGHPRNTWVPFFYPPTQKTTGFTRR